jgi:hypothetical protein
MIYSFLIPEPPIQVLPALAEAVGFNEATAIQIIHFWINPRFNRTFMEGRYWVENLPGQLSQRFSFWDVETIGYMVANLEQSGILMALSNSSSNSVKDSGGVTYHTLDYDLLRKIAPARHVPDLPQNIPPLQEANTNKSPSFTTELQEKGDNIYAMVAQDLAHFLECELILEIQEKELDPEEAEDGLAQNKEKGREVICHFPSIDDGKFKELILGDQTLYGTLMIRFQIKIMNQLFLFCAAHHAGTLVIFTDDVHGEELEIYRNFLNREGQDLNSQGEKTGLVIPADPETVDDWKDFRKMVALKLRQGLWRDQKTNPTIENYLKSRGLPEF